MHDTALTHFATPDNFLWLEADQMIRTRVCVGGGVGGGGGGGLWYVQQQVMTK